MQDVQQGAKWRNSVQNVKHGAPRATYCTVCNVLQQVQECAPKVLRMTHDKDSKQVKENAIKEGWYVDLVTVRDKCAARIKRDQKNQKAEPLMISVPGFLSAVSNADELMLYAEVVGYAFDTVGRHNSMALRNSGGTGGGVDPTNLGLAAMEPKTGQVTRNSKTYTFKIWCEKCPHPGEPRARPMLRRPDLRPGRQAARVE